jgi:hypothetical protein
MVFVPCKQYNLLKVGLIRDGVQAIPIFLKWSQVAVDGYTRGLEEGNAQELGNLSIPPTFIVKSYNSLPTYGNHFRVASWPNTNTMVIYDSGVMGDFDQTPLGPNQIGAGTPRYKKECT